MFCCMGGNDKKELPSKTDKKDLNKGKKPQDMMKDSIPLSLSEKIRFSLDKNLKWTSQASNGGQTRKKDQQSAKENLSRIKAKFAKLRQQCDQLQQTLTTERKKDEERVLLLSKAKAEEQVITFLTNKLLLEIQTYKQKFNMCQEDM